MTRGRVLVPTGLPAGTAQGILGNVQTGQTATGSTQATAFPLAAEITAFSTVAASTGAILPSDAQAGDEMEIYNGGANSLTVYPPVGGTINNLAANTGLALATLKSGKYKCLSGGSAPAWYSLLSG